MTGSITWNSKNRVLIRQILSAIDILNFYLDLRYDIRKNTNTKKDRNCFEQAVKWELMEKNPCTHATVPKHKSQKRDIWTADTLMYALSVCEDERLKLAINLSFSCSLRLGEMLGLTWDCVDISPEAIEENRTGIRKVRAGKLRYKM
ncbi:hypothetical protein I230019B6_15810 [Firmicutes bacterium i23-0019-B6]